MVCRDLDLDLDDRPPLVVTHDDTLGVLAPRLVHALAVKWVTTDATLSTQVLPLVLWERTIFELGRFMKIRDATSVNSYGDGDSGHRGLHSYFENK